MKNIFKSCVSLLLVMCMVIGFVPGHLHVHAADTKINYLALGDSVTAGEDLTGGKNFATLIAEEYNFNLVNKASGKKTSGELKSQISSLSSDIKNADVITITATGYDLMNFVFQKIADEYNTINGTNVTAGDIDTMINSGDLNQLINLLTPAQNVCTPELVNDSGFISTVDTIVSNLKSIVSSIKASNKDAVVIIVNQYDPFLHFTGTVGTVIAGAVTPCVTYLNNKISAAASSSNYSVADAAASFNSAYSKNSSTALTYASDALASLKLSINPTAAGHTALAEAIKPLVKDITVHTHEYSKDVTAPTCTAKGYTTYTCTCGDSYVSDEVAALGHSFTNYTSNNDATCTKDGTKTAKCDRCDAEDTKTDSNTATGHKWNDGVVTKEPTETATGTKTYTCTVCSETMTETIPALEHTHTYNETVVAPTCIAEGYTLHTCSCGDSYKDTFTAATGHKWNDGVVTKEPTETATGTKTYTCTVCSETKTETIPALEHTHAYEKSTVAPTCTTKGYTTYTCACGDTYVSDEVAALGHSFGDWIVVTQPTTETEGEEMRTCTVCSATETRPIDKLDSNVQYDILLDVGVGGTANVSRKTAAEGETVVVSFIPEVGYELYSFVIYTNGSYFGDSRFISETDIECVVSDGDLMIEIRFVPTELPFVDVKENDYYYTSVEWAVANSITSGMDATHFDPSRNCTRAQVVTFLWRAAGCPEPTSTVNPFTDVKSSDYFYKAVLWAVECGITNGMGDKTFAPNTTCTRGQVVTFLWRFAGTPEASTSENEFTDVQSGAYYADAVRWAVEYGITNGMSKDTFAPNATCTRGQIVTFLFRACA